MTASQPFSPSTLRLRDAMRGVLWERKFRGTLDEAEDHTALAQEARRRWLGIPKVPVCKAEPWPEDMSPIGVGTFGWKYQEDVIEEALGQAGILDTAEGYGFGRVENALGRIIDRFGTRGTWIASKVARNHLSETATYRAGLRSRERLCVDALDLYQIHWPVIDKLPETLDGLARLVEEGVVDRIGVCNFCAGQLAYAQGLAQKRGLWIESNQIRLNPKDPGSSEYLTGFCRGIGVYVIAYSPLAQGKARRQAAQALAWVLANGADYAIPRTSNVDHLRENLAVGARK